MENAYQATPFFTNDAIVLGLLMSVLALVFYLESSKKPFWVKFFTYIPSLLLCYFLPALLKWPLNLVDGEVSQLYYMASRYLLPAALILLCIGIDFKGIMKLGPKAIIMFLAGTLGVIIGGPVSLLIMEYVFPSFIPSNLTVTELWRGMSTIAGSWIGGGANQTAMKEIFDVTDNVFGIMIVVDVIVANIWMGFLLYGANIRDRLNRLLKADNSAILELENRMADYQASVKKIPTTTDSFILMAIAFGSVALSHWATDLVTPYMQTHREFLASINLQSFASSFFWLVVFATTIGLGLSFTKARKLEGVGATRWGSVFIYVLVATIGMKMDLKQIFVKDNIGLFMIGITWMLVHIIILLTVAKIIRAPFFFVAVGSQANIGGAASAPIVASAFNPSLASVGVLMAVLGYALGTYGALICAILMEMVAV
ncbi:MAG: DUF819 family protein [Flavobacteriaceae bacterium]|nr:DUF819 family protein [Flavobacteriaceae bacterium]